MLWSIMNRGQEVIVEGRDDSAFGGMFFPLFCYLIRTSSAA